MKDKVKFKVLKDNKRDGYRRDKKTKATIVYPKYKAKVKFDDKTIEFMKHRFGTAYTIINFKEWNKIKIPKNRIEYGEDYTCADGSLLVLNYKLKNKKKYITQLEIIR